LIAAALAVYEHALHLLTFLFLLACPEMRLFVPPGHGQHHGPGAANP
jgi:hypothetical protein